jgi:hypothetical protein
MAEFAHSTPIRASSSKLSASISADDLLDAYSSWLFFERHFLHIGRFGIERALGLIDTVQVDNAGAVFHLPLDAELPDYSGPARRAALVLSKVGLKVRYSSRCRRGSLLLTTLPG